MSYNILLVDDDVAQANVVEQVIHDKMHYRTQLVENGQDAIDLLTSKDASGIDLVLLDIGLPGIDGIQVLNAIKPVKPNLPVIVRTGYDDLDLAVDAMKAGAVDFVQKMDPPEKLKRSIDGALRRHLLNSEMSIMKESRGRGASFNAIIGNSPLIKEMIEFGKKVAKSDIPVLLEGESGTGKELMARAIHACGNRAEKPFIAVNCGAIPENLVESILFGHEKGAFTGAVYKTFGKFREADGGTLFLDEVGELPADIQVKLLRVLQDGEIDPVGSKQSMKVDVRVISATNRNLAEEVNNNKFREDLFYRLSVFPINTPSLRQRKGDLMLLVKNFVNSFASAEGKKVSKISKEAEELLTQYSWPGNIRQLKNAVFRAVVLAEGDELQVGDFPQIVSAVNNGEEEGFLFDDSNGAISANSILMNENNEDYRTLSEIERDVIMSALDYYKGHMSKVAKKLGIGRSTLYRKLEEFDIPYNKKATG
ncbi:MAG: sigma-54 dependent transcriptional regulator [Rickettsiales bacterium]|nr:sigma-54 dependent transcriptional regulator [Pseudomonadota bacterium]MDA0967447.1 sigma-54 dependent transcriptional regulator [Pseudomonadota bacterium]MDG4544185.1 sigma-54 dependent transcriptional regulator [Rickettsiales bacterium]MDG4546366.1 sigma-54 dependent transcriptional regulator [Rickettsiales bacterium]MDG4548509.1 sigma-54 dependent transcriptional regulator [Rickettsiales bacterium]